MGLKLKTTTIKNKSLFIATSYTKKSGFYGHKKWENLECPIKNANRAQKMRYDPPDAYYLSAFNEGQKTAKAIGSLLGLIIAVGLTIHKCESKTDRERKTDLIENIVKRSLPVCDSAGAGPSGDSYASRLKRSLSKTKSEALNEMIIRNAAFCLDQHIPQAKIEDPSLHLRAAFYNNNGQFPIITTWDNGGDPDQRIVATAIENLTDDLKGSRKKSQLLLGFGSECYRVCPVNWEEAKSKFLNKNPAIGTPPVKAEQIELTPK